jgi:hypothetical protein
VSRPPRDGSRRRLTAALALALVAVGLAVVVRTAAAGVGGGLGFLLGGLMILAGALRLYLVLRRRG